MCVLFLDSTYTWDHTVFAFLSLTYFTERNAFTGHPCCQKWPDFLLFYGWMIFHCLYIPCFLYPFILWWILRMFSYLGYCEWCYSEYRVAGISSREWFCFLWVYTQKLTVGSYRSSISNFLRKLHTSIMAAPIYKEYWSWFSNFKTNSQLSLTNLYLKFIDTSLSSNSEYVYPWIVYYKTLQH